MNRRGTKVGPRDRVVVELRRMAKQLERAGNKAMLGPPFAEAGAGLRIAATMLDKRATRLERAARKGAR